MSKIICDICGTTYQDTAECCPICGCARDVAAELLGEDLLMEEVVEEPKVKGGRFVPKKKEIFDYDEVNAEPEEEEDEDDEDYDEEEEEEAPRHNTIVVVLLTILIAGLLIAAGFIFFRYFLPNMKAGEETMPETTAWVAETSEAAEEATVPCDYMHMLSAGVAELNTQGQQFLIHMQVRPENTTDKLIFTSGNENIATVTEDGKITAVSEGETIIYISCGKVSMECPVVVKYVEETVPPTTEAPVVETIAPAVSEETQPLGTEAVQTEPVPETTVAASSSVNPNVVLKLKEFDIKLGVYYSVTLKLDCDLQPTDVQWSSEHPHIAKVDEKGFVTALKAGTTDIVARYGDQEVKCRVRCG